MKKIPNWSYLEEYKRLKPQINQAVQAVFASGRLILGQQVETFEQNFSKRVGLKYGVGVNSGTDAIFLALKALDVGPGDEVITVPNTAVPTVAAIRTTGATPVFVDIDPDTYLMDVTKVEAKISPKTKVILPVHLYGQAVDMDPLVKIARRHKLSVVEDCAQSHGTRYKGKLTGTFGKIGAFSFYPTKILGAYGDGGMCFTARKRLAEKLKMLRMYGMASQYYSHLEGYNSRLDEVQAAILNVKLKYLDRDIKNRQKIASIYNRGLKDIVKTPQTRPFSNHTYYLYVAAHPKRDKIIEQMARAGIEVRIHFPFPIHTMKAYRFLGYQNGDFPVTEKTAREIFSLPIYADLKTSEAKKVVATLRKIIKKI